MPGFHICVLDFHSPEGVQRATHVESTEIGAPSTLNSPKAVKRKRRTQPVRGSDEDRANRSQGVAAARAREQGRAERDQEIIRLYDDNHSINGICKIMMLDQRTVSKVVRAAADTGRFIFRGNTGRPAA